MNIENLTNYQKRAFNRFRLVREALDVFELFFEIGYRTKQDVYTQLCMYYPDYDTADHRKTFQLLWNFVKYDAEMIRDLELVVNRINAN